MFISDTAYVTVNDLEGFLVGLYDSYISIAHTRMNQLRM